MNPSALFSSFSRKLYLLTGLLVLQALLLKSISLPETFPVFPDIEGASNHLGAWKVVGDELLDPATQALLQPDISVVRHYRNSGRQEEASLFIGYFKSTQPNHPGPHSPSVCLPASGWKEIHTRQISLDSPGEGSFHLNEYLLRKGEQRLIVYYWYQNLKRTWASEVWAKVFMLPDFYRYRRTDVALVRVTAIAADSNAESTMAAARDLAIQAYRATKVAFADSAREPQS